MRKTIMIIDDQRSVRKLLEHYLSRFFNVIEHSSAIDALAFLEEGGQVDAIIADILMPKVSGIEFLKIARSKFGEKLPPVIMLSCRDDHMERINSIVHGAQDYMHKPFNPEELKLRLNNAIDKAEALKRLQDSNAELQQFANVVSHDLNQPLRMVQSYLNILETTLGSNITTLQKECIGFAVDGATRMEHMIHDLLQLAKVDQNQQGRIVDLSEIIEQVKGNLNVFIAERNATVIVKALPNMIADKAHLLSLFQNLIENGIKYNESKQPIVVISSDSGERTTKIIVADNGIGIAAPHREEVFLLFRRLAHKPQNSGTGMGLSICKKITEKMDGKISIQESVTGGTAVHLQFSNALFTTSAIHEVEYVLSAVNGVQRF
jgi:signal transduction histidine kinase